MFLLSKLEKYNVILASKSPRRQELLSQLGVRFTVCDSFINETVPQGLTHQETAQYLAQQKAEEAYYMFKNKKNLLVIGGDTIVTLNDIIMGKPNNRKQAMDMLRNLSGESHQVISGVSMVTKNKTITNYDETTVLFESLSDEDILYYVDKYMPYDKAGAYGIQEWIGCRGVKSIEGSYFTVMGMPTNLIWSMLHEVTG
ncbi:MAG: septum formation protein Maf [Bacteroidales bacterium]|nr:septum formation protein Maf [Bacteroidales bacterium]